MMNLETIKTTIKLINTSAVYSEVMTRLYTVEAIADAVDCVLTSIEAYEQIEHTDEQLEYIESRFVDLNNLISEVYETQTEMDKYLIDRYMDVFGHEFVED